MTQTHRGDVVHNTRVYMIYMMYTNLIIVARDTAILIIGQTFSRGKHPVLA